MQLYTPSLEPTIRVVVGGNIEQGRIIPRDKEFCRNKRNIARLRNSLNINLFAFHLVFELPLGVIKHGQGSLRDFWDANHFLEVIRTQWVIKRAARQLEM